MAKVLTMKQCRPDAEEMKYFWKLFRAAQRIDGRWGSDLADIAEELAGRSEISREQKLFILRAWQVLVDGKGGFGRFMGAFNTYVYNVQDPNDDCVAYKPELLQCITDGNMFDEVLEAYGEARQRIAEQDAQLQALAAENAAMAATFKPDSIPQEAVDALHDTAVFDWDSNDAGSWSWIENGTDVIRAVLDTFKPQTPATDAILLAAKKQGRIEGAHFVSNRMLAAWSTGFVEDTAKNAADISRMILTATEFMADAPEGDFDRAFSDEVLGDIAQQLRGEADNAE